MNTISTPKRICIDDVPNEILADIFRWVSISSANSLSTQNGLYASEVLSQVCSLWRKLAHGSPKLWTELILKVNVDTNSLNRRESLTHWFSRSRAVDIVLTLDPFRVGMQLQSVISTVCDHSNLWRRFRLSLPWAGIMSFFLIGTLCTPQLEELVVECVHSNSPAGLYPRHLAVKEGSERTVITDCGRLRKVCVALLPSFPLELLCNLLPWSGLTEVIIQKPGAHPTLIHHVFMHCKSLVRLKIWTAYWRLLDISMEPSDELRLEHLESFEVEADLRALVHILRSVQLPALKSLTLSGIANHDEELYPVQPSLAVALMELGDHAHFDLVELKICGLLDFCKTSGLQLEDLLRFLASHRGLTSLALKCRRREDAHGLLNSLSTGFLDEGNGRLAMLPKLTTIDVDGDWKE
ncbi:hypothetical protein DFH05DRAFT_421786 [Lentinula detonsa]|uniref:F-box domain-containing protein n=1 Tax=Lentinula detonsa TaxID=2804962 RepID=A0A9W8TU09_9AGAR|nr:hypothetical protein DFH05DRAFT_421786 [Lentinula detonsa]